MSKRNTEIMVGVFMVMGLAALAMLALKVSGLNTLYSNEPGYTITMDFSNIAGLKVRSRVTIAGVAIGRVVGIQFEEENYAARVQVWIKGDVDTIPDDSQASILTAGFLGDNYVGLSPGYSHNYLKEGSHIALEDTSSGIVLEDLISKFVAGKASNTNSAPAP